jgi:hypothetical protein
VVKLGGDGLADLGAIEDARGDTQIFRFPAGPPGSDSQDVLLCAMPSRENDLSVGRSLSVHFEGTDPAPR